MTHLTIPILLRAAWCLFASLAAFWVDTITERTNRKEPRERS